ncbi:MAG: hypothetical protein SGI72_18585 [Planctomycetota bacterium]|nr:hypothetical protein [Planctomycetota bacterium]
MSALKDPEFQALLKDLVSEERRKKRRRPNRFEARGLLLPLGTALLDGDPEVETALAKVRVILESEREAWHAAFDEELTLAATEHVRSCDPGFLKHPHYDFPYTVAARHRLEARLQAAEALDLAAPENLLDQIERADRILAPYLDSRDTAERG